MQAETEGRFRTVKNWLQKWLGTIKEAFLGVSEVHEEARAVAGMEAERLEKLVELWDKGLREAAENAQKSPAKTGGEVKYSFAGERAETADREQLHAAQKMEKQGIDAERIRQETGWFRGMDNKWRFEIDDSGMQLFPGGDAQFAKDHPEYTEYKILLNKAILGTITEEELARVKELEQTWGRELPRLSQRVQTGNATLGNILQHDALFEAYPELKSLRIRFNELAAGERGQYVPESGTIVLSNKLKNETNGTLLHEIQHAIQHFEDFTHGATPEYWQNRIEFLDGRIEADQSMLKAAEDKIGLKGFVADSLAKVSRGERSIDEHWRALQEFKNNSDQGEEIKRLEDDLKELRSQRGRLIDANEAYFGTAGEIEARDTAKRAKLSAGERKSTRPDLDRKGVVFAENGDESYSMVGVREDGIEVYETSKETKALSWKERKRQFMKLMRNEYRNRTARFTRNGHVFYASFEEVDIQKNAFGDTESDKVGHGVKINAGADGDFIDLIENTQWFGGQKESGKTGKAHKGVLYWDYFIKTVKIDGRIFDLLANIRQKSKDSFVYSVELFERKDIEAALPQSISVGERSHGAPTASDVSILPSGEKSNTEFQERDALPDDRALLMQAEAEGRNAEALTAYQKKVKSLEALERKLQRQQSALEELKGKERIDTASESTGVAMTDEGKSKAAEQRKAAIDGWVKQIQKTEASIRRAENALNEMERSPELRQETQKALEAWREANPQEAAKAIRGK